MHAYSQATHESRNPTLLFEVHEPSPLYKRLGAPVSDGPVPDGLSLHESIQRLFRIGNRVRNELIAALRTLHEEQLYLEVGYSSFTQYCQRELGVGKSTAYEWVRTGIQLDQLPGTRSLHEAGDLSWEQVREITKVATAETEREWVNFAHGSTNKELRAEVKDAVAAGREAPRSREHGLPNVTTRLTIDVTREERERLLTALAIVAEQHDLEANEITEGSARDAGTTSGDSTKDSLFQLVDAILSGQLVASETPSRTSYQSVVYHHCPQCQDSTVSTSEGPVEISPRRFDIVRQDIVRQDAEAIRIEPTETAPANVLPALADGEIDQPNSTRLIRQVLNRDGKRCANPGCGSRHQLQAHHIVFRAEGGRTVLANEVAVCSTCHSLIHEGLLEVTGSAARSSADLKWTPRCRRGENTAAIESMWQQVAGSPHAESAARTPAVPRLRPVTQEVSAASVLAQGDRNAWIRTLRSMGFSAEEARESVDEAVERLERSGSTATDATVMKAVFDRDR